MSFVISRKQYLAPNEPRAQYEPLILEEEDFEIKKIDVTFGHPLYTTVADIFYIRSNADIGAGAAYNSGRLYGTGFFAETGKRKIYGPTYAGHG